MAHDLIDTTEMYLRTIFELEEEGIAPLRARIVDRLGQSAPTVSQTVARMARDGLLSVEDDRHVQLTPEGRALASRVMRKHRLAECLLIKVIGLEWELVHDEACRWEHVISEQVERRMVELLGHPTVSPFGNPIPALDELGDTSAATAPPRGLVPLSSVPDDVSRVVIHRIGEPIQSDTTLLSRLRRAGANPGSSVVVSKSPGGLLLGSGGEVTEISPDIASHVFVSGR